MIPHSAPPAGEGTARPHCMELLELLPPYTIEDVHRAYKACALKNHPDHGGKPEDFVKLRDAYNQAQEFVRFHSGRREWLAAQVEPYMIMQEVITETERRGGSCEVESFDWMHRSFGDFSTLADRLRVIHYTGKPDGDDYLEYLTGNPAGLHYLQEIDLSGTNVTSAGLGRLSTVKSLRKLNLQRTGARFDDVVRLTRLPDLRTILIKGARIPLWQRMRLGWKYPQVQWKSTK